MGNLIPAMISSPFAVYGMWWMSARSQVMGLGFWLFAISPVAGWIGMNFFGLYGNRRMKRELLTFLMGLRPNLHAELFFVGIATPKYSSLVDPHEDVGFLILLPDRLEFFGDHLNLSVNRRSVLGVDFRMNPHTLVGLGRWVSVEGRIGEKNIRLQLEPREKQTLLGNLRFGKRLKGAIERWLK